MQIVINLPKYVVGLCCEDNVTAPVDIATLIHAVKGGAPLPEVHGRLGDLDELEQRISNFVERDADITDEYTVARQRFIIDGIKETPTIIEADKK